MAIKLWTKVFIANINERSGFSFIFPFGFIEEKPGGKISLSPKTRLRPHS